MKKTKKRKSPVLGSPIARDVVEDVPKPPQPGTLPNPVPIAKPDKKVIV